MRETPRARAMAPSRASSSSVTTLPVGLVGRDTQMAATSSTASTPSKSTPYLKSLSPSSVIIERRAVSMPGESPASAYPMYSGESGRRMRGARRPSLSEAGPASRLNRAMNADWLPLVSAMLRSVTSQPCSRRRNPARARAKPRSPCGASYVPIARSNAPSCCRRACIRTRKTISAAGMRLGFPPPRFMMSPPPAAIAPRSSMSERVPDSLVSRCPNAETFMPPSPVRCPRPFRRTAGRRPDAFRVPARRGPRARALGLPPPSCGDAG